MEERLRDLEMQRNKQHRTDREEKRQMVCATRDNFLLFFVQFTLFIFLFEFLQDNANSKFSCLSVKSWVIVV